MPESPVLSPPSSVLEEIHQQFEISGSPQPGGSFEILAITAGTGNGWEFPEACLSASLALWDKVECFVDHEWTGHALHDLAGICHSPDWDVQAKGVRLQLKALGPSGPLLVELGKQMLTDNEPHPHVGFSADVIFSSEGKKVKQILRVLSVDLVFNPARGGAFLRALNSIQSQKGSNEMPEKTEDQPSAVAAKTSALEAEVEKERQAMRALMAESTRLEALKVETEKARQMRADMCGYLLESALSSSKLPAPSQAIVRKQFAGKVFETTELQTAIDEARNLVSELTAGLVVQGPGRLHAMFDSNDKLQAAMDDLLGAPRDPKSKDLQIHRPTGIRELYLMLTGDYDLHGGYYPDRAQFATTADFTGLVKNALNKIIVNQWAELGRAGYDWWTKIATVEHFDNLNSITGVLVGTVGSLPTVAEGGEYTELAVGDSPETASFVKYGGYIPLSLELIDRDTVARLKAYPIQLANAALRNISALVAAIFSANAGAGPTMADTGALFNNTVVTTLGGHANLLTVALTAAQWDVVGTAVFNQPLLLKQAATYYGTGPKMGINPRYLLVPRALMLTAKRILYPDLEYTAQINSQNQLQGNAGDVVVVPDWTDVNDWAVACDPAVLPAIFVGERFGILPEVFIAGDSLSPAVFMNDETRLKVRQFIAVWVNDFRPLANNHV
jgi:hypothetical protein